MSRPVGWVEWVLAIAMAVMGMLLLVLLAIPFLAKT